MLGCEQVFGEKEVAKLGWGSAGADYVVESTGMGCSCSCFVLDGCETVAALDCAHWFIPLSIPMMVLRRLCVG